MSADLADLFPGFASHWIDTEAGRIFARSGGSGPPVVLIHGFPQTHVEWHLIAPELAQRFTVVALDLRGYGWSSAPRSEKGELYAKRAMGGDIVRAMEALGHARFAVVGHDRGARVAYRLALDHPGRVSKLALLDIMPTITMWEGMDAKRAMQVYHWSFLAQSYPLPETLISKAPLEFINHTLASWTKAKSLAPFDDFALAHYRAFFSDPSRIHACCEDYRAGATIDVEHDRADRESGKTVLCPTLILWGDVGIPAAGTNPHDVWRASFTPGATGQSVDSGHFLPEENPSATLAALAPFLAA
ncbi:alpha/beta hydrolase [Terrarubrum flagellatum]|uniref:alpha/beta hydrolase n=1 Tax=Terrirubrum flagellatum TaxID=2895980 RepID=UPI003145449F